MTSKFDILVRVICGSIVILVLLYNIGVLIEEARKDTRNKIIEAVEACYNNDYSIVGPVRWEIINCIKNAKIK